MGNVCSEYDGGQAPAEIRSITDKVPSLVAFEKWVANRYQSEEVANYVGYRVLFTQLYLAVRDHPTWEQQTKINMWNQPCVRVIRQRCHLGGPALYVPVEMLKAANYDNPFESANGTPGWGRFEGCTQWSPRVCGDLCRTSRTLICG